MCCCTIKYCFILLCIWRQFPSTSSWVLIFGGAIKRRVFLRYEFGGLYLEGLIFGILWYNLNISAESLRSFKCKWLYSSHTLGWSCDKRTSSEVFGSSSLPSWLRDNYNLRDLPFNSLSPASIILARARLSVSADKQKKQASSEKASEQKRRGKRDGESLWASF